MGLRCQFGSVLAAFLAAGLLCGIAYGQVKATPHEGAPERPRRSQQGRSRLPNALPPGPNANKLPPKAVERLEDMTPEQQERFLENNQRFQSLSPEQKAQIQQRLEAWNRLAPEQQQALRDRQHVWEQMTPEQRKYVQQSLFPRWKQLPLDRRQAILHRLHSLRDLSESDRQAALDDPAFTQGLSPEDREMLGQLAHLHVGMASDPPGR